MSAISSAKNEYISPLEFEQNAAGDFTAQKIAGVYTEYQKIMRKNNALDFDDLLVKTVELFKNCPDVLALGPSRSDWKQRHEMYMPGRNFRCAICS